MGNMGRPRALSDAERRDVCTLISTGCGFRTAADYVGCSPSTIRREALRNPEFYEQVRNADLSCQLTPLQAIRKAAATNWRAAAWLLERTNPQRYGNQRKPTKPAEVAEAMIDELFEAIRHEIKDDQLCHRIGVVVRTVVGKWQRDDWAEEHHRRNPARAKRLISEIEQARQPAPTPERPAPKSVFARDEPRQRRHLDIDPELKRQLDADAWPSDGNPQRDPSPHEANVAQGNPSRARQEASSRCEVESGKTLPHGRGSDRNRRDPKAERAAENAYCAQRAREAQAIEDARQREQSRASQEASSCFPLPSENSLPHGRGSGSDKTDAKSTPTPQPLDQRAESPHQNVFKSVQKSDASNGHQTQHPSGKQGPLDRPPR